MESVRLMRKKAMEINGRALRDLNRTLTVFECLESRR